MNIKIPINAKIIIERLENNGHDAYVVGGCVRDSLLGRTPGDWDITTAAKPMEVKSLFKRTIDTGIEHGTVTVMMKPMEYGPLEAYEVTTYRIDGDYSDHRRPDRVEFSENLIEDLKRRDFTINAMAYNPLRGIVDEFDGIGDLDRKIIRCVGVADERFEEDALRMLRAIRFSAQLGFDIEEATVEAIKVHAPQLSAVSAERILVELTKTIKSNHPERLQLLWNLGLADYICPSFKMIKDASGVDAGSRSSWAALMRNLSADDAKAILKELKSDNDTIRTTTLLVDEYKRPLPRTAPEIKRCLGRIGEGLFTDLMELKLRTDPVDEIMATANLEKEIVDRGEPYLIGHLDINGNDIMALGYKGKEVGEKLAKLLDMVIEDPGLNDKKVLIHNICK